MTNLKSVDDTSLSIEKKVVKGDVENQNKNNYNVSDSKENLKTQTNITIKQDSKKPISKSLSQKIIKNKQEMDISKQRVTAIVTRTRSKKLNKSSYTTDSVVKHDRKNKKNDNKEQIVSPNHSITEYFSSLDLKEELKGEESNKKLEKIAVKGTKNSVQQTKKTDPGNHKLTEYFQIRRSDRKLKKTTEIEKQKDLEKKIVNETEDGLEIKEFNEKGRGIVTTKVFYKGDFVIEYIGDLIDRTVAQQREAQYAKSKNVGCYMYYFRHKDQQYCIDATKESGKLGRLINHSRKGNLISRIVEVSEVPHLVLFAKAEIPIGTELLYDYGDRNQESIKNHPWLTL